MPFKFWSWKYRSWSHEYVQPGIEFILVWAIVAYMQIDRNLIDRRDSLIDGPLVVWTRDPSSRDSSSYFVSFISLGVLKSFSEGSSSAGSDEACSDLQQGWKNTNTQSFVFKTSGSSSNTWIKVRILSPRIHCNRAIFQQYSKNKLLTSICHFGRRFPKITNGWILGFLCQCWIFLKYDFRDFPLESLS